MVGRTVRSVVTLLLLLALMLSCKTTIDQHDTDLTPDQFFQQAIDAVDSGNYKLALSYYEGFLERYPDDLDRGIWAQYEIAFLHHKMGDDRGALELFNALLELYRTKPADVVYPTAPYVLTNRVRDNILAKIPAEENMDEAPVE